MGYDIYFEDLKPDIQAELLEKMRNFSDGEDPYEFYQLGLQPIFTIEID